MPHGPRTTTPVLALALIMAVTALTACGGPRSVDEMSDALLTVGDLPGVWTENRGDPSSAEGTVPASGIVPDDQRGLLPTVDLCDAADDAARDAADRLRWEVFRQFDATVDDPVDPPTDPEGHKVFLQQFMMSDEPEDLSSLLADLVPGVEACLGPIPAGEEGPGTATAIELTSAGDEHVAVLTQIEEAGGRGMWFVYNAIVRKGSVLMSIVLGDVYLGELKPEVDLADFDAIVTTAVDKL